MKHRFNWGLKAAVLALSVAFAPAYAASKGISQPTAQATSSKQPTINRQQQAGHVAGTPQHVNRLKTGTATSTFFGAKSGEALARKTWETGTPVKGRPQLKERTYSFSTGIGPNGGFQKSVRVSMNGKGQIHGHPVGKEYK